MYSQPPVAGNHLKSAHQQPSSKRNHPRPKPYFKHSPGTKVPSKIKDRPPRSHGPVNKKPNLKETEKKKKTIYSKPAQEGLLKKDFQQEMKEFVSNHEREGLKASVESKMAVLLNLMHCLAPYENTEKVNLDFIQGFLEVGDWL